MAGDATGGAVDLPNFGNVLTKAQSLIEWPGEGHGAGIDLKTHERGAKSEILPPFMLINAWRVIGPWVIAWEAKDDVGCQDGSCNPE